MTRGWAIGATGTTIVLGLAARRWLPTTAGEHLGNVLWGLMWTWIVLCVRPRCIWWIAAFAGLACCATIEFLQLTEIPQLAAKIWPATRWLLGYGFDWKDLIGNTIGAFLGAVIVWLLAKSKRSPRGKPL